MVANNLKEILLEMGYDVEIDGVRGIFTVILKDNNFGVQVSFNLNDLPPLAFVVLEMNYQVKTLWRTKQWKNHYQSKYLST